MLLLMLVHATSLPRCAARNLGGFVVVVVVGCILTTLQIETAAQQSSVRHSVFGASYSVL